MEALLPSLDIEIRLFSLMKQTQKERTKDIAGKSSKSVNISNYPRNPLEMVHKQKHC